MSWAAHEFENYVIQKEVGLKASFLAIVLGAQLPDLFTKSLVYASDNPAKFHRGWPGVGFSHSLIFGFAFSVAILGITKSRSWALGVLIGQWAHVLTDFCDTAGTMPFFPFSTEPVTISMWKHAAAQGRYGDAAAYYSSLGGVWDLFWLIVLLVWARNVLRPSYFRSTIVPADPKVWGWMHRRLRLPEGGLILFYWGYLFYGAGRMTTWFLFARLDMKAKLDVTWSGPSWVAANDLSDAGWQEVLARTAVGGVLFFAFIYLCWRLFLKRWWDEGEDPPSVRRGKGLRAAFGREVEPAAA